MTQAFSAIQGDEELSWLIKDPSEFPNGPSDVQAALLDNRCWAAVTGARSRGLSFGVF